MAKALRLLPVLLLVACSQQPAFEPSTPASPVLARVDGFALTEADLEDEIASLPREIARHMDEQAVRTRLAHAIVRRLRLAAAAKKLGVDREPEVQRALARAQVRILAKALEAHVKTEVPLPSEEEIRARYEAEKHELALPARVQLAVIVVARERDARRLAHRLARAPERFASYARRHSSESHAQDGGRLGWRTLSSLPPAVQKALAGLAPGQVSAPVRTDKGWAIYQVLAREPAHVPPFEEVRDELAAEIVHERVRARLDALAKSVPVQWIAPENAP